MKTILMASVLVASVSISVASAEVSFEIVPSIGPSGDGAGWETYRDNSINALRGLPVNNTGGPGDYAPLNPLQVTLSDMLMARLYFGVSMIAPPGSPLRLSDINYSYSPLISESWEWEGGWYVALDWWNPRYDFPATSTYTSSQVGVRVGFDGQLGTPDDIMITSGAGTQEVDAVYMTGVSCWIIPSDLSFAQERVPFLIEVSYLLWGPEYGYGRFSEVMVTPEPTSLVLLYLGSWALVRKWRWRPRF